MLNWNINGVWAHELELFHIIRKYRPDVVILTETTAVPSGTLKKIWAGCTVEEIPPYQCGLAGTPRSGVVIGIREGIKCILEKRLERSDRNGKDLAQVLRVRVSKELAIVGTYISPGLSPRIMAEILEGTNFRSRPEKMFVGDFNARHESWDKLNNSKGKWLAIFAHKNNLNINPPPTPSFRAKGRNGDSKPDLMLLREKAKTQQPSDKRWNDASDHTPIIYEVGNIKTMGAGRRKITKTLLKNKRNVERAKQFYERQIPKVIEMMKRAGKENAQSTIWQRKRS